MLLHTITFDRLESDYEELGDIRSIEVDHSRRRIILVCDEIETKTNEGATIKSGLDLNSTYSEVETPADPLHGFGLLQHGTPPFPTRTGRGG